MDEIAQPTRADARIDTLDLLRGVAVCGILLMNIPGMGTLGENEGLTYPFRIDADWIAWFVQQAAAEGTMRGLFTILFGAGMLLMLRHAEGTDPRVAPFDVWARRCLGLLALGIVQAVVFLWPGEILWTYGLAGLALTAFRLARPRTLLIWAAIILAGLGAHRAAMTYGRQTQLAASVPALAAQARGARLTEQQTAAIERADKVRQSFYPKPAELAKEAARRTRYPSVVGWSWEKWTEWHLGTDSWLSVAEQIAFMLIGMALFRTGILTGSASPGTYLRLMAIGYGLGIGLRAAGLFWGARTGFEPDPARMVIGVSVSRAFLYEPLRLLVTLGHVGLLVTLFRGGLLGRASPVRAMGRMALTIYSLQSIVTALLFYGLGYVGAFGFATLMAIAGGIWIASALFALAWFRGHAMGPAERALRWIGYGRRGLAGPVAPAGAMPGG